MECIGPAYGFSWRCRFTDGDAVILNILFEEGLCKRQCKR